jgi:hypothetical protein
MFLGLDQLGQFLPLLLGGIDTGWVLSTSVEQELLSAPYFTVILKMTYDRSIFGFLSGQR